MALNYSTIQKFWKFLGINKSIMDFQPGKNPERETVASSTVTAGTYYLDQLGVNEDTVAFYAGTGTVPLTDVTDYSFDSDTSKVTITASGAATLSGEDLTAEYEYCSLGQDLNYNESLRLLEQSEKRVNQITNCTFANQTATSPEYLSITDELHQGEGYANNLYYPNHRPLIKLQTTVSGDYVSGNSTITLTDASGFPETATIYIGGEKVTYTSKSGNVLTIPSTTASVDDTSVVRGEVVEVSTSPSGVDPTFAILSPDSDYAIDYNTGRIQLLDEYYYGTDTCYTKPVDGVMDRFRLSYQHAWHDLEQDAVIPEEIEEAVYMVAGRNAVQRTILKSNVGQRDNFNVESFGFSKLDLKEKLSNYTMYHNSNV